MCNWKHLIRQKIPRVYEESTKMEDYNVFEDLKIFVPVNLKATSLLRFQKRMWCHKNQYVFSIAEYSSFLGNNHYQLLNKPSETSWKTKLDKLGI